MTAITKRPLILQTNAQGRLVQEQSTEIALQDITASNPNAALNIGANLATGQSINLLNGLATFDKTASDAAKLSIKNLALTALSTGVAHIDSTGNFTSSTIVNADVDAAAAIAGTKISPDFGSQNIQTTGSNTVGSLKVTSLSTGLAHLDADGDVTSSLLVDADVDNAAAIAGTKISPNFGSQVVETTGSAQVGSLKVTSLSTGIAHLDLDGDMTSSLLVNADVDAAAAIDGTKISPNFGAQNVETSGSLQGASLRVTSLGLGVAHLDASGNMSSSTIVNADVDAAAAIAYSKLNLADSIVNADISSSAAIAYSKLNLNNSIVNADVATGANIAYSKLNLSDSIVNADISSSAAIAYSKLNLASSIVNADVAANAAIAYSKLDLAASIMDSDVAANAAIAGTKISPDFGSQNITTSGTIGNGTVLISSDQITGLAASPSGPTAAASKAYVDSVAEGLDVKASCVAATTANITLSGEQTIDGVALVAGQRVLVKNQTNAVQNGIYVVASGAWSRAADMAAGSNAAGAFTFIEQGSNYADTGWVCSSDAAVVGTDPLAFTQFSSAGVVDAGAGLEKTGNTIAVKVGDGIEVVSNDGASNVRLLAANSLDFEADASAGYGKSIKITAKGNGAVDVANGLSVNVDGTTIDITDNNLNVLGLPLEFTIAGTAVTPNATAANMTTLFDGEASNASALHTHAQSAELMDAAEAIAAGDPVCLMAGGAGKADASTASKAFVIGIAKYASADGVVFVVRDGLCIAGDFVVPGANAGDSVYLDAGGGLTSDPGVGAQWVRVGYITAEGNLFVQIQDYGYVAA